MVIKSVQINNFRCIRSEALGMDALTVLVGANGTGKSSFLNALELFYTPELSIEKEDFFANATETEATIAVTFYQLSKQAKELFEKYLEGSDELTVVRAFRFQENRVSASYHGSKLQVADFVPIRAAKNATEAKDAYNAIKAQPAFADLPAWGRSKEISFSNLEEWENTHQDKCVRMRDDGQFFGYKEVSAGYLGRFSRFVLVPAVRDAAGDGGEGKGSLFTQLIDIAIRSNTTGNAELNALSEEMKARYDAIISSTKTAELKKLEEDLTRELANYVTSSDVELSWDSMPQVQLPPPRATAKIGEEGHRTSIERKGHGLQRAFIMILFQYLEAIRRKASSGEATSKEVATIPSLVLAIEEPELYQHPDRQRHFAKLLALLAQIASTPEAPSTQVIYTTHSPHFVGLDRFESIRLIRKNLTTTAPEAKSISVKLDAVSTQLAGVVGGDPARFTGASLKIRLQTLMTPWMNEGFFARIVVLVEGEQDRAALLATATTLNKDLESLGIAVIPCMGKTNLDRPALIFRNFGIPIYIVWDSDKGARDAKPQVNKNLLRLMGGAEEDYPNVVTATYSAFENNLEETLNKELTAGVVDPIIQTLQDKYEMTKDDVLKNPMIMAELLSEANKKGKESSTLKAIIEHVCANLSH